MDELKRREELKEKITTAFEELTANDDIETLKANRKWLFRYLLEMFGMWKENADCVPSVVEMGLNGGFLKLNYYKTIQDMRDKEEDK
jgi:hypothetical protein